MFLFSSLLNPSYFELLRALSHFSLNGNTRLSMIKHGRMRVMKQKKKKDRSHAINEEK